MSFIRHKSKSKYSDGVLQNAKADQRELTDDEIEFIRWVNKIEENVQEEIGEDLSTIPDQLYWDYFSEGTSTEAMTKIALQGYREYCGF